MSHKDEGEQDLSELWVLSANPELNYLTSFYGELRMTKSRGTYCKNCTEQKAKKKHEEGININASFSR